MGYVQGERIRGNRATYPELVRQAVAHWLDQERMAKAYELQRVKAVSQKG
jgi:hypothetical protein